METGPFRRQAVALPISARHVHRVGINVKPGNTFRAQQARKNGEHSTADAYLAYRRAWQDKVPKQ